LAKADARDRLHFDHEEHDEPACHFALEATIASGPVHIAVDPLKFGLLFHGELRKIDNIPSRDFPRRVQRTRSSFSWRMLRSNDDMHRIIAHLIRRLLGFEIKRAETAVVASGNVKLRVQIEHQGIS